MTDTNDSVGISAGKVVDDYDALKRLGLSSLKASEIVLDAGRGDIYAISWIKMAQAAIQKRAGQ